MYTYNVLAGSAVVTGSDKTKRLCVQGLTLQPTTLINHYNRNLILYNPNITHSIMSINDSNEREVDIYIYIYIYIYMRRHGPILLA